MLPLHDLRSNLVVEFGILQIVHGSGIQYHTSSLVCLNLVLPGVHHFAGEHLRTERDPNI